MQPLLGYGAGKGKGHWLAARLCWLTCQLAVAVIHVMRVTQATADQTMCTPFERNENIPDSNHQPTCLSQVFGWVAYPEESHGTKLTLCAAGCPLLIAHEIISTNNRCRYGAVTDINIKHSDIDTFVFITYGRLEHAQVLNTYCVLRAMHLAVGQAHAAGSHPQA